MKANLKKFLILNSVIAGIATPLGLGLQIALPSKQNTSINKDLASIEQLQTQNIATTTNKNFVSDNASLEPIASNLGPIVIDSTTKSKVINYDWYYNEAWSIDVSSNEFGSSASIEDWEYLPDKDFLFLITDKAVLIKLKASTGQVLASITQIESSIPSGSNKISKVNFNSTLYVWSSKTSSSDKKIVSIDANTLKVKDTNIGIQTNSLFNILGLDVGYNLAISTTDNIADNTSNITSLKLEFVDDTNKPFTTSTNASASKSVTITPNTSYKNIYNNVFKRNDSTFIVLVFDKLFKITLNKQDMSKSSIIEINSNSSSTSSTTQLKPFSSAFMTQNGSIFMKSKSDSNIYRIAQNSDSVITLVDLKTVNTTTNSALSVAANKTDED